VADALGKPIETAVSAVQFSERQAKQTNQTVQRRIVGPLSPHAIIRISIAKPKLTAKPDIDTELAEMRRAWRAYQSHNSRDAVYTYLSKVFAVVTRWQRLGCAFKNARAVLRVQANAPQMKSEPFAIVIFCTSDADVINAKTRSKWSRVLRYVRKTKPSEVRLIEFIKSKGGLNECARGFTRSRQMTSDKKVNRLLGIEKAKCA
jgi:hypothetical protein